MKTFHEDWPWAIIVYVWKVKAVAVKIQEGTPFSATVEKSTACQIAIVVLRQLSKTEYYDHALYTVLIDERKTLKESVKSGDWQGASFLLSYPSST